MPLWHSFIYFLSDQVGYLNQPDLKKKHVFYYFIEKHVRIVKETPFRHFPLLFYEKNDVSVIFLIICILYLTLGSTDTDPTQIFWTNLSGHPTHQARFGALRIVYWISFSRTINYQVTRSFVINGYCTVLYLYWLTSRSDVNQCK